MITLRRVTEKNVWEILALSVADDQKEFVASNAESMAEAYTTLASGGICVPFGVYEDDTPVGFLMIGFGREKPVPELWVSPRGIMAEKDEKKEKEKNKNVKPVRTVSDGYSIWRVMIDKNYQGRGYGREAMRLALTYIWSFPFGKAPYCTLSFEPENKAAAALYHSFGFTENGERDENEIVAVLPLL